MEISYQHVLVWLRRDLRLHDHTAWAQASQLAKKVSAVFVFDTDILANLANDDRRVAFIWACVADLKAQLQARGGDLWVLHASASTAIPTLAQQLGVEAVFTHADYEPAARERDARVRQALAAQGIAWRAFHDQVIFSPESILSQQGRPLTVFSAYQKAWLKQFSLVQTHPQTIEWEKITLGQGNALPDLSTLGFGATHLAALRVPVGERGAQQLWENFQARLPFYHERRDFPAQKGVSYLSTHLRFGTLSPRPLVATAWNAGEGGRVWLSELIWREFFMAILWHFPHPEQAFQPRYRDLTFPNSSTWFQAWCEGQTGYPLVDAAMRQLRQIGWMHNRLRMIVASFLVKDLLIDWRWGERWFAQQLLDFDLSANNGNWQWAASTGCDAQPYFRIFNPTLQSQKFDPDGAFIRRYVPELAACSSRWIHAPSHMPAAELARVGLRLGVDYPYPLVDHATQRQAALSLFKTVNTAKDSGMLNASP